MKFKSASLLTVEKYDSEREEEDEEEANEAFGQGRQQQNRDDFAGGAVPDVFQDTHGGLTQEETYALTMGIMRTHGQEMREYQSMTAGPLRLSQLEAMYKRKETTSAMRLLLQKKTLTVDEDYLVDSWDGNVQFGVKEVCVAFLECVRVAGSNGIEGTTGQVDCCPQGIRSGRGATEHERRQCCE